MSRKTLLIVLFVSLAVNLFLVGGVIGGLVVGQRLRPDRPPMARMNQPVWAAAQTLDPEKAKALVAESGVATPIDVRIGYRAGNQRRTETVAAIQSACKDAGFNVIDSADPDFFTKANVTGDYEVALYAWAGSGQITSGENIYATGKPQNTSKFSSPVVDAAWAELVSTLDPAVHLEQTKIIEKELWDTLFGIPVFAAPGLSASSSNVQNVRSTATQDQVVWNAPQWVLS